jgi:hypothetical protein
MVDSGDLCFKKGRLYVFGFEVKNGDYSIRTSKDYRGNDHSISLGYLDEYFKYDNDLFSFGRL